MASPDLRFDFAPAIANAVTADERGALLRLLRLRQILRRMGERYRAACVAYDGLAPDVERAGGMVYGDGVRDRTDGRVYYRYTRNLSGDRCISDVAVEAEGVCPTDLGERAARLDRARFLRGRRYRRLYLRLEDEVRAFFFGGLG